MNIEFDRVIAEIVEQFLPRSSRSDLCIIVPVEIKVWNTENDKSDYNKVFMLFNRDSNYMKVCMSDDKTFDPTSIKTWALESYHDSCWRSDGFSSLRKIYDNMIKELGISFPNLNSFISFGLSGLGFYQGDVVIQHDERIAFVELKKKYYNFDVIEKLK